MRTQKVLALLCGGLLLGVLTAAPAPGKKQPTADDVARAEKAVKAKLEKMNGAYAMVEPIKEGALRESFPGYLFFSVLYRQYPVGRRVPEGLKSSNVFAVGPGDKIEVVTDVKQLEKFFKGHLRPARSDDRLKDAARAWLRLDQQLHQDGFYKFARMDDSLKVRPAKGGKEASGTVVVMAGGSGTLGATLDFDAEGKLTRAAEENKIRPGPRPICQATKLLDRDPVVRRMAEQDLLIMGRAARPYLDEQRAKASPELRRAIDRLWQRIEREDR